MSALVGRREDRHRARLTPRDTGPTRTMSTGARDPPIGGLQPDDLTTQLLRAGADRQPGWRLQQKTRLARGHLKVSDTSRSTAVCDAAAKGRWI